MTREERHFTKLFRANNPLRGWNECLWDARRHIHFRETMRAQLAEHERRSKAAKKAWKARRAKARAGC